MLSKCLILTVSADYAFVLIWLAICSLYTTILTVIALSVVWILRKRRSSILKSQRPARTPFSELEFNVVTPTDSAKSRRVSFLRRTDVAEFVTNESTTTWKNVYEEHNKSLESSGNDSEANASRQPVGHLGKRIFDQQFEEVEAIDFISGLPNGTLNVNFSQQLASLECTGEGKLTAPHNKFELSAFTEQSENDEDISISDTVLSPVQDVSKSASIDNVSLNNDWVAVKENIAINPYDAPCESNFAVNEEPDQVLVFGGKRLTLELDIPEKDKNYRHTLLPDPPAETPQSVCGPGCALYGWESVQFDDNKENNKAEEIHTTQSLPNNITVNDNDASRRRTIVYENYTGNISITQAIPVQLIPGYSEDKDITFDAFNTSKNPSNTKLIAIVSNNDEGDISMTEAIPANIIEEATNERKSLIYDKDEADIGTTLALSTNVFLLDKLDSAEDCVKKPEDIKEDKEKVIDYKVYEEDAHNPTGDGLQDDQKSIVFNADDLNSDVSMSKTILKVLSLQETEKRNTVIFNNDNCDISMTRPIPAELITVGTELLHKSKNIILDATEPDQGPNLQSYVIVLQPPTTNSEPSLLSNTAEQGVLKNTMDIYRNVTSDSKNASLVNVVEDAIPSSAEDASANASLLHPRLKQKLNQLNLINSSSETNVDKVSDVEDLFIYLFKLFAQKRCKALGKDNALIQTECEERNKSLPSLLTTSATSVDSGTEDKNFMCRIESKPSSDNVQQDTDVNTSNERMICISIDSDYDTQTDRETDKEGEKAQPKALTYSHSPTRQLEYKEEKPVRIDDRQIQLEELQSAVTKKNQFPNRFIEYVVNTDLDDVVEKDENVTYGKEGHNCKKANDTQELLHMTTNFTDNRDSDDDVEPAAVKIRSHTEVTEPNRLSFAPNRQSIALSREDLLNNISMAQAGLQKSRLALDDSDCTVEDTRDASLDISQKSNRTSSEVVKTLQFDDGPNSYSLKLDTKYFPLKKTAFDETSYMNETKSIVIPTYLKEVSVGIKELMLDLVKPMNDNLPFESVFINKYLTKIPSTQSMQIQANLSSQVEDCELFCNMSVYSSTDTDKVSSLTVAINKSRSRSLRNLLKFSAISSEMLPEFDIPKPKQRYSYSLSHSHTPVEPPPDVLVFDHLHPLNNLLLAAFNYFGVHRYNAEKYDDTLCDHNRSTASHLNKSSRDNDFEVETVTTAEYRLAIPTREKEEDVYVYKNQNDQFSIQSTSSSRPIPIDQSIDAFSTQLRDDQVNTMSAMKGNKDLLEASSSLTLVNDALDGEDRLSPDNENENRRIKFSRSNLVDIEEQVREIDVAKSPDSALSKRIDSPNTVANRTKGTKRIHSPSTDKCKQYQPAAEVTLKPITKMQKISNSPNPNKVAIVGKAISKDGIKKLMLDLVKPMNDNLPFESVAIDKCLTKIPSTQSTQIQSDLSSQVDLDCELFGNADTNTDTDKGYAITTAFNKSRYRSLRSLIKFFGISSEMSSEFDILEPKQTYSYSSSHSHTPVEPLPDVVVFDRLNPLNNILLAPLNYSGVRRYNLKKSDDTLCDRSQSTGSHLNKSSIDHDLEVETVTTSEYRWAIRNREKQENVYVYEKQGDQFSIQSDGEGRLSPDNENENRRIKFSRSNIFDIEEQATEIDVVKSPDSALSEQIDNPNTVANRTKGKKRIYNPSTDKYKQYQPAVEVTPKPITKMQKISNSPNPNKVTVVGRARSKDGIKELMLDLVKPMNDNLPFESVAIDKGQTKIPSTQSTHIQADLVISSQVDLVCGLFCNADTNTDTDKGCSLTAVINKSRSRSLRSPVKFSGISSEMSSEFDIPEPMQRYSYSPPRSHSPDEPPPDVLVFDNLNPLNNILLAPLNYSGVHRYNPKKSDDSSDRSRSTGSHLNKSSRDHDLDVEPVTTAQYRLAIRNREKQEDVYVYKKQDDQFSIQSTSSSRPTSIDQSIDAFSTQLRDHQVNTVIAMKENKDLLEAISSLPLVDGALDGVGRVSPDNENENRNIKFLRSILVNIEEQATEIDVAKSPDSALSERIDNPNTVANRTKSKKRIYSPSMDKYKQYQPAVEVTPKPITKMQEISNSPNPNKEIIVDKVRSKDVSTDESTHNMAPEKDVSKHSERCSEQNAHTSNVSEKKSPKVKGTKQGPTITVQQIILDYLNLDSDFKHIISEKKLLKDLNLNPKSESFTASSQSDMSFSSSNNLNAMKDANSSSKTDCRSPRPSSATMQGMPSQMDSHPDLMFATNSNVCSSDSSVNVVAKINMLPFMGSHECKWESSSADTWSFRLLHGRLRLMARLAHRHANGTRTRVRGDTPVLDVAVETVQHDRKNPVATITVRFASETMRYIVARLLRATCTASDMPPLLRHCAAVARLALRWGRAMHDAKLHLAYNLDNEGNLSLKVANFPLRSVWKVTMRIEMVLDNSHGEPGPRAGGVHVAGVVSDVFVSDADVARALAHTPRDWGHAPRTVWKIFSYLKHKTRTETSY